MTDSERALSVARKRRGVIRASITRSDGRIAELEGKRALTAADKLFAQNLLQKLGSLDVDFRSYHLAVVDLSGEDAIDEEQAVLDEHDDRLADFTVRLQQLTPSRLPSPPPPSTESESGRHLSKRLSYLKKELEAVVRGVESTESSEETDPCLLAQYEEQLSGLKAELASISRDLLSLDDVDGSLTEQQERLSLSIFDIRLKVKHLLSRKVDRPAPTVSKNGVKLPTLAVPTFDGNIISWRSFWEQYTVSVHERSDLSPSQKLTYLKQAVKDSSAKHAVEGLSGSGDQYEEAVECLRKRFDRPRLLHQAHVRAIVDAPSLKDGNGKELRRLHDTVIQHLRALKTMKYELPGHFITSLLELKLDPGTTFEWQRFSQDSLNVPHVDTLMEFIDLRAQASESAVHELSKKRQPDGASTRRTFGPRPITSLTTNVDDTCVVCRNGKHPLYGCRRFKALPHDQMLSTLRAKGLCLNCLRPGHFVKECTSTNRCRMCQKAHHTLLHVDGPLERHEPTDVLSLATGPSGTSSPVLSHVAHASSRLRRPLLMTARILVMSPDGCTTQARALLDSASSTSFISERLAQHLRLPRFRRQAQITGIGGLAHTACDQSFTCFRIAPVFSVGEGLEVEAIILPKVTSDLPLSPVPFDPEWHHLSGVTLADPDFGSPGMVDVLLGVDVFSSVLLHGRRFGSSGSPSAFETRFGWVLAGAVSTDRVPSKVVVNHASVLSTDDLLRRFWETEELTGGSHVLSAEEKLVVTHFQKTHSRDETGRFMVPLPMKPDRKPLGESRSAAVRRFLSMERSLRAKGKFGELSDVVEEYFKMGHAKAVPRVDLDKPCGDVFYLPMHAVVKESSTTTKVRAVFDASTKSSTGVSLNDQLLVGPTVHPPLVDVLMRFRLYQVALSSDVSRMYRAVLLPPCDRDLHRFVWRSEPDETLKDYRMTRVTFGVASSSFAANMAVKQNAIEHADEFPLAAAAVHKSFYVDDGLVGAVSVEGATELQQQLQSLFARGGFLLRKWKSSHPEAINHLPPELLDSHLTQTIRDPEGFAKALGVEWSASLDCFRLTVAKQSQLEVITKRALVSDIAKTFDVLGWFAPAIVKVKTLLQRVWEAGMGWDDPVPPAIHETWKRWRLELPSLATKLIPRCYHPEDAQIVSVQLHGFSDASEVAYAGVIYLRAVDTSNSTHVSLVAAKTKVAPLKRQTIPRLELCGANLLASLLSHVKKVLDIPTSSVFAWTDSTVVLSWLSGNPRRFNVFVGNRVSSIVDHFPSERWRHVPGTDNPADAASRGMFPSELLEHELWWNGPEWLHQAEVHWPHPPELEETPILAEEKEISLLTSLEEQSTLPLLERSSSFNRLTHATAWMFRFANKCRRIGGHRAPYLAVDEILHAERFWIAVAQQSVFAKEIRYLKERRELPPGGCLASLRPMVDVHGILRVGGRIGHCDLSYSRRHPAILPGSHLVTKLIIRTEHLRLLHAGPTLIASSLSRRFHILSSRKVIRSITRACVVCRRVAAKPRPQLLGQLPADRTKPGHAFERVGVDYAGPVMVKSGSPRKPVLVKAYVSVFVCLSVKAVHLELVSDLTSEAFLAALRRFVSRRGKPSIMWSDNGTNFVGAASEGVVCVPPRPEDPKGSL